MMVSPLSFLRSWEGFLPPGAVVMTKRSAAPAASGLTLGIEAPGRSASDASALLDKILAALEIDSSEIKIFEALPTDFSAKAIVRFVAESGDPSVGVWENGTLCTYSLRAMLGNPGLKKLVWGHLKTIERNIE